MAGEHDFTPQRAEKFIAPRREACGWVWPVFREPVKRFLCGSCYARISAAKSEPEAPRGATPAAGADGMTPRDTETRGRRVTETKDNYEGWTILELMGHRRLAGYVREQSIGGAAFIRIDVPGEGEGNVATQFYSPSAVYCMTPTTEDLARKVAQGARPAPVTQWDLPQPSKALSASTRDDDEDEGDGEREDDGGRA